MAAVPQYNVCTLLEHSPSYDDAFRLPLTNHFFFHYCSSPIALLRLGCSCTRTYLHLFQTL